MSKKKKKIENTEEFNESSTVKEAVVEDTKSIKQTFIVSTKENINSPDGTFIAVGTEKEVDGTEKDLLIATGKWRLLGTK